MDGSTTADGTVSFPTAAKLSYVWAPPNNGTYYLSCTVGQHCARGQIITVTVGGGGPAGYVREGHSSSAHDHSAHDHGDGHAHDTATATDPDDSSTSSATIALLLLLLRS
jgi:hypothetical protein